MVRSIFSLLWVSDGSTGKTFQFFKLLVSCFASVKIVDYPLKDGIRWTRSGLRKCDSPVGLLYFRRLDGSAYSRDDYYTSPNRYRSVFADRVSSISVKSYDLMEDRSLLS